MLKGVITVSALIIGHEMPGSKMRGRGQAPPLENQLYEVFVPRKIA